MNILELTIGQHFCNLEVSRYFQPTNTMKFHSIFCIVLQFQCTSSVCDGDTPRFWWCVIWCDHQLHPDQASPARGHWIRPWYFLRHPCSNKNISTHNRWFATQSIRLHVVWQYRICCMFWYGAVFVCKTELADRSVVLFQLCNIQYVQFL